MNTIQSASTPSIGGSQKSLMLRPGISLYTLSPKALLVAEASG